MKLNEKKIILAGGAGLVGQNLITRLQEKGYQNIIVLDKHKKNLSILSKIHTNIIAEYANLSQESIWERHFENAYALVMLQAQIGGNEYKDFLANNIHATRILLKAFQKYKVQRLIHISSSVVESVADDFYTNTKKEQEEIVLKSKIPCVILRPTLMFGYFDRKHLGWLSRFIQKAPIFPIPGNGRFMRQPLYAGDFSQIIISCLENPKLLGTYNISGHEKIDYIDIIKAIKKATHSKTIILRIPYTLFYVLLWIWGKFYKDPPFTTQQLAALVAKDEFEVIDWPSLFSITCTPFQKAIEETFQHPIYSKVVLEF